MPAPDGERKIASVLFADLTGYTALASSLDPEEVHSFVAPAMRTLCTIAVEFGGTVLQIRGDGILAVFGVPAAQEDHAERAVRRHVRQLEALGFHVQIEKAA